MHDLNSSYIIAVTKHFRVKGSYYFPVRACVFERRCMAFHSGWVWLIGVTNNNAQFLRFMDISKHFEDK